MARLPEIFRTQTFRLTLVVSCLFGVLAFLFFVFIYWRTGIEETKRVDRLLVRDAEVIAAGTPQEVMYAVRTHVSVDFHHISYAALFDAKKTLIAGNLADFPATLLPDGSVHRLILPSVPAVESSPTVRMVARSLPDGATLVIGRNVDSLENLEDAVWRALELGVVPCVLLSLLAGFLVAHRTQRQVKELHLTIERIMRGNLLERLPASGGGGDLDRLAVSVNHMLDEIGRLLDEVKSTGDNIAHDLRTPLTRVRSRLERARETATNVEALRETIDRALAGLDQTLRIITALLRISEIEGGRRRAAFRSLELITLVEELSDFYAPLAEEKRIRLVVETAPVIPVHGDRDLLSEALANLIDNAIKFSPSGGVVRIQLVAENDSPVIRVLDNGPGIPQAEREAVLRRFYRSDKSRHVEGSGLGLSIVDAVVRLHGFRLAIKDAHPGCTFELFCEHAEKHVDV